MNKKFTISIILRHTSIQLIHTSVLVEFCHLGVTLIVSRETEQSCSSCIPSMESPGTGKKKLTVRVKTYRSAADRQNCDGNKTGGLVRISQRTREECCIHNNKVESCTFQVSSNKSIKKCSGFTVNSSSVMASVGPNYSSPVHK